MKIALLVASATLLYAARPGHHLATMTATSADTSASFAWNGSVPSGGWLRIRNIAGDVEVRRSSGSTVEVRATREPPQDRWSWGSVSTRPVRFVMERQGSDIVICGLSEDVTRCDPNELSSSNSWDSWRPEPMRVTVLLPANVSLQTGTMHGDVSITGATGEVVARSGHGDINVRQATGIISAITGHGDVEITDAQSHVTARTGHGDMHIASAGPVSANTGHGDIVAELGSAAATASNDMSFETGHGNISVRAPRSLNGIVNLRTGRGDVSTSFPLTMDEGDRHNRHDSAHGTLGNGGRAVRLFSGHGDVSLSSD